MIPFKIVRVADTDIPFKVVAAGPAEAFASYFNLVLLTEATRAESEARALEYGISDSAAARLFTSSSTEAAFASDAYREGFELSDVPTALPEWNYARTGDAMAPAASGLLEPFASGAPRITDAGLRIEPASSNTARPGNDFTAALWNKTGVTLSQSALGPFGTMTRVTATSAGFHFVGQAMDSVGTVSCYVRAAGIRRIGIQIEGAATKKAVFDAITGAVISADAGVTAWVDPGPLGTFRLVATVANTGAATVRIHALDDTNADTFAADGTKGFDLSAVQAEPGAIVTSYIDTAALAASRALDAASMRFEPAGDFTIFAEVDLRRAETENTIASLIGTTPNDRVTLLRDAAGRLAVEAVNGGVAARATRAVTSVGIVRCAISVRGTQTIAAFDGDAVLTLAATRPPNLQTLWLGIRGTDEAALNGSIRSVLTIPRALSQDELLDMTSFPRSLTVRDGAETEAVRQMLITHANDQQPHGLPALRTSAALAESKTGIWTVAATDGFSGTDGTPLGTTETGGFTWVNPGNFQRVAGRAKQPANAFGGAAIDTMFSDGQIEADLYPGAGGEASLVFRSNTNFNQYMLLQRGGDGTVRLAFVFTQTELLVPFINLALVPGERWKVRFVGPRIFVFRIIAGVEEMIFEASDPRLTTNLRHGIRLNGNSTVDNFRVLKRESI